MKTYNYQNFYSKTIFNEKLCKNSITNLSRNLAFSKDCAKFVLQ